MWIAEFSEAAGLGVATVRFYVREGLLQPRTGHAGGTRPYLDFSQRDLRVVAAIRAGQAMGMSLAEIKLLMNERRAGGKSRMLQAMLEQRDKLSQRAEELAAMRRFVDEKILWLRADGTGSPPEPPVIGVATGTRPASPRRRAAK